LPCLEYKTDILLENIHSFSFPWGNNPTRGRTASCLKFRDHTQAGHNRQDSSGQGIGPSQRPLTDNKQRHVNKRAATDLCFKARGHRDRQPFALPTETSQHKCAHGQLQSEKIIFACIYESVITKNVTLKSRDDQASASVDMGSRKEYEEIIYYTVRISFDPVSFGQAWLTLCPLHPPVYIVQDMDWRVKWYHCSPRPPTAIESLSHTYACLQEEWNSWRSSCTCRIPSRRARRARWGQGSVAVFTTES
jgi:hypothetical protein